MKNVLLLPHEQILRPAIGAPNPEEIAAAAPQAKIYEEVFDLLVI